MPFVFVPPDGYRNVTDFPTKPTSEADFRNSMQNLLDQLRDYLNGSFDYTEVARFKGGVNLNSDVIPPAAVGALYTNGASGSLNYHDLTGFHIVWHDGNNPASLGANGYQKLPSGMIMQWGKTASIAPGVISNITFPIVFPGGCKAVIPVTESATASTASASSLSTNIAGVIHNDPVSRQIIWMAVGF